MPAKKFCVANPGSHAFVGRILICYDFVTNHAVTRLAVTRLARHILLPYSCFQAFVLISPGAWHSSLHGLVQLCTQKYT